MIHLWRTMPFALEPQSGTSPSTLPLFSPGSERVNYTESRKPLDRCRGMKQKEALPWIVHTRIVFVAHENKCLCYMGGGTARHMPPDFSSITIKTIHEKKERHDMILSPSTTKRHLAGKKNNELRAPLLHFHSRISGEGKL